MPRFYEETKLDISPSDFLSACTSKDIKELIEFLRENGHLTDKDFNGKPTSPMEEFFEKSVDKLHGAYHILGTEDIETIERISKRL